MVLRGHDSLPADLGSYCLPHQVLVVLVQVLGWVLACRLLFLADIFGVTTEYLLRNVIHIDIKEESQCTVYLMLRTMFSGEICYSKFYR